MIKNACTRFFYVVIMCTVLLANIIVVHNVYSFEIPTTREKTGLSGKKLEESTDGLLDYCDKNSSFYFLLFLECLLMKKCHVFNVAHTHVDHFAILHNQVIIVE